MIFMVSGSVEGSSTNLVHSSGPLLSADRTGGIRDGLEVLRISNELFNVLRRQSLRAGHSPER